METEPGGNGHDIKVFCGPGAVSTSAVTIIIVCIRFTRPSEETFVISAQDAENETQIMISLGRNRADYVSSGCPTLASPGPPISHFPFCIKNE